MIRILDKNTTDKIAAGEVIERPVSIVKELIENALDSGASSVVCEIKNGGKTYIRVTDDGCGIRSDETETAFLRHATSKISDAKDLESIETLGFRGEALASIAAVTHTELITKSKDEKTGTKLIIHGGTVIDKQPTGCPNGTTVIITDLFYNTPARLKFMKSDGAESGQIIDLMSRIALAYKNTKFRFINNGKVLFSTLGDGNRLNAIIRIFPEIDYKNLVAINGKQDNTSLEGYISTPAVSKNNRGSQIFFVNGRTVKSSVMDKGVTIGYKERLFEGRHPVAYLFLEIDPASLDVNIHPNKTEVRFDNEAQITEFIGEVISTGLKSNDGVVKITDDIYKKTTVKSGKKVFDEVLKPLQNDWNGALNVLSNDRNDKIGDNVHRSAYFSSDKENNINNNIKHDTGDNKPKAKFAYEGEKAKQLDIKSLLSTKDDRRASLDLESVENNKTDNSVDNGKKTINIYQPQLRPFDFEDLKVTGVIFDTYITCVDDNNFYLFDQHAAHERIFYEELVGQYDNAVKYSQPLMVPSIITVSLKSDSDRNNWLDPLNEMGFVISEFGPQTYRIEEIPMFMELGEAEDFINSFIENIGSSTDLRNTVVVDKLIMMSCKAAVKANDVLKPEEIKALIDRLSICRNPFSCPHGRPTFIKMSRYEIEKMFKRV